MLDSFIEDDDDSYLDDSEIDRRQWNYYNDIVTNLRDLSSPSNKKVQKIKESFVYTNTIIHSIKICIWCRKWILVYDDVKVYKNPKYFNFLE